jgi:hypothetical protein
LFQIPKFIHLLQEYKGLFRGELVIKTLACHFSATKGAIKVRGLALEAEQLNAKAAVALSAAAVRHGTQFRNFTCLDSA